MPQKGYTTPWAGKTGIILVMKFVWHRYSITISVKNKATFLQKSPVLQAHSTGGPVIFLFFSGEGGLSSRSQDAALRWQQRKFQ